MREEHKADLKSGSEAMARQQKRRETRAGGTEGKRHEEKQNNFRDEGKQSGGGPRHRK